MVRLLAVSSLFFPFLIATAAPRDPGLGTITNPVFSVKWGSSPGLDQFDISGSFVQGTGAPALNLPSDPVTLSFDGGKFIQTLPANSFTCNSGGTSCTYSNSTASGITSFVIKPVAKTFSASVRKIDLSQSSDLKMNVLFFSVAANVFSFTPNSAPVAVIHGPSSANVGNLLTFDASSSTDYNRDPILLNWQIISQPLGSSATLTSTNQPTTSLTVTNNGLYVLKCTPNDGKVDGVPALVTVNVTGGATLPPPAPTNDNGLIVLSSDLNSYLVGQTATLSLHVNVPDGNGARRYYFAATYDDQPVTLTTVTSQVDYSFVTPAFGGAGTHVFKVVQFTEDTDISDDLNTAISNYNADIVAVGKALQYETDPAVISQLQSQIARDQSQISADQQKLAENRTQLAGPAVLSISVN